jgi:hypothetical protein
MQGFCKNEGMLLAFRCRRVEATLITKLPNPYSCLKAYLKLAALSCLVPMSKHSCKVSNLRVLKAADFGAKLQKILCNSVEIAV